MKSLIEVPWSARILPLNHARYVMADIGGQEHVIARDVASIEAFRLIVAAPALLKNVRLWRGIQAAELADYGSIPLTPPLMAKKAAAIQETQNLLNLIDGIVPDAGRERIRNAP